VCLKAGAERRDEDARRVSPARSHFLLCDPITLMTTIKTSSLWSETSDAPSFGTFREGLHVDVAVVGAGITGLTAAFLLTEAGKNVAVLEMGRVADGESARTTAHITQAVDVGYHALKRRLGVDAARLVADATGRAIGQIEELVQRLGIDCDFRRVPAYAFTEKRGRVAPLKSEAASAKDAGLAASWTAEVPLPFATRGAVRFENQAAFHPRKYLLGIAARIAPHIFENVRVERIVPGEPCTIETSAGRITAADVFVATNAPLNDITLHTRIVAQRTYVIAAPMPPIEGLFWDTAEPYHYLRWHGSHAIIGGEDHKVGEEADEAARFDALEAYAKERFGHLAFDHRWSGQIIEPLDGLPYIGKASEPHVHIATGYSGQGMTLGTAAAILVTDLITGRDNAWAELFSPSRLGIGDSVTNFVRENADFVKHIAADRIAGLDIETTKTFDVRSGEGKIVFAGDGKLAVHRDDDGVLHALEPACRHMGCDVAWNSAERTWDCPCHGSRYAVDGAVINGPATEPLRKVEIAEEDRTRLR
jgi:glycine/D-amino acid oxidase-like deaminating enzyme/nitrite reductase/ring-hydroxylating ferredoxin subunit